MLFRHVKSGFGGLLRHHVDQRTETRGGAAHARAGETVFKHPAHRARPQIVHRGRRQGYHVGLPCLAILNRFPRSGRNRFLHERPTIGISRPNASRGQQCQCCSGVTRLRAVRRFHRKHTSRGRDQTTGIGFKSRIIALTADRRIFAPFHIGVSIAVKPFRHISVQKIRWHVVVVQHGAHHRTLIGTGQCHQEAFLLGCEHGSQLRIPLARRSGDGIGQFAMQHHIGEFLAAEQCVAWRKIRPLPLLQGRQKHQVPMPSRRARGRGQRHRLVDGRGMRQRIRLDGQRAHLFHERFDGVRGELAA